MARKGLPKKYAKMGFSKGWKAYKAAQRKQVAPKKTTPKSTAKTALSINNKPKTTKRKGKSMRLNTKQLTKNLTALGLATVGAIGGNVASNMVPIKNPKIKSAIPVALALYLIAQKNAMLQTLGVGMGVGGGLSVAKAFFPKAKFLAGEGGEITIADMIAARDAGLITDEELTALTDGSNSEMLGVPETYAGEPAVYAGEPYDIYASDQDEF